MDAAGLPAVQRHQPLSVSRRAAARFPATVTVHTEPDWNVVTGMAPTAQRARTRRSTITISSTCRSSSAGSTWTARGSPTSGFDSRRIPAGAIAGAVRSTAWDQLKRVIPPEIAVFGETPWENYTVMQIVDSSFGGASGLEHQNSHVDILAPPYVGSEFQPSLYAHEIFHSWNVKRLRPAEMWPYDYSRPQPTPWLWVSEGITDYYADLAELRGGVVDEQGFYALTAEKINEVERVAPVVARGRVAQHVGPSGRRHRSTSTIRRARSPDCCSTS